MNNQNGSSNKQPNQAEPHEDLELFSSQTEPNEFEIFESQTEPNEFETLKSQTKPNKFETLESKTEPNEFKALESQTKPNELKKETTSYLRKRPVKPKKSKRQWLAIILSIFSGLAFIFLLVAGAQLYFSISSGFTELSKSKLRSGEVDMEKEAFSILLLGTDERQPNSSKWHPDTLMVAVINPKTHSVKIISIPRDLKVKMPTGEITKITHSSTIAYKHGIDPIKNIRETVENFLNIPIDYFARINFNGFVEMVDAVDGIEVNVTRPFSAKMIGYAPATFKKGINHLNGSQALTYARERKQDPLGDIGRSKRQRETIVALLQKLSGSSSLFHFFDITTAIKGNFSHSFKLTDYYTLAQIYQQSKSNLELLVFDSKSAEISGEWYELWTSEERETVSATLQKQLEYKSSKPLTPSPLMEKEEQFASIDDDQDYPVFLAQLENKKDQDKDKEKTEKKEKKEKEKKKTDKKEKDDKKRAENKKKDDKKKVAKKEREKEKETKVTKEREEKKIGR